VVQLKEKLNKAMDNEDLRASDEVKIIQQELEFILEKEDTKWKQRAKANWLRNKDRNTKFYHACVTQRRRANQIEKITDEANVTWESLEDIKVAFVHYFSNLFTAGHIENLEECIQGLCLKVTEAMNEELLKVFTSNEVELALKQMAPLKAPGPNGLPAGFFQNHWESMGEEICMVVTEALNSGNMPICMNETDIALIPKVKNPMFVIEFWPISLCNVLYKLISKVLANRLKKILLAIVSYTQRAFIPGRLITDNILAVYETLHTMHTRLSRKTGYMVVKLYMSKAYDQVE
jgi:hypothetical protein